MSDARQVALHVIAGLCDVETAALVPEAELVSDLGIDSAKAVELLVELEERLNVEIDDDEVVNLQTVGQVLALLEKQLG